MEIGLFIKLARIKAGLTQTQLAEKIGVKQKDVSRWETGERKPRFDTLAKIVQACNADITVLMKGESKMKSLSEITNRDSGLVLYDTGDLLICNWSGIYGMPRLDPMGFAPLGLGEDLEVEEGPIHLENIGTWLEERNHNLIYDRNNDYPTLDGQSGTLYRINEAYVIAPDGWH